MAHVASSVSAHIPVSFALHNTMNILLLWSILALLVAALPVQNDHLPTPTVKTHNTTTSSLQARQSPRETGTPISPLYDPEIDEPEDVNGNGPAITSHNTLHPRNYIPERVISHIDPVLLNPPVMFHRLQIFDAMNWGHEWLRNSMTSEEYREFQPLRHVNGQPYPIPFAQAFILMFPQPGSGELDWHRDSFFEYPIGRYGIPTGFPGTPATDPRGLPSETFVIFGYRSTDTTRQHPIYVGVIYRSRRTFEPDQVPLYALRWCPIVNYDATAGPENNPVNLPWTGQEAFNLSNVIYTVWTAIRDWRPTVPLIKTSLRRPSGKSAEAKDQPQQSAGGASEIRNDTQAADLTQVG
ncbi:hypothetical protein F5Y18DRAFT_387572 [Xylariaceae sp. FL1019]|nr:hypothetical protein F5Y18DRAFT_387572 [Xylariaceae sp. FL1019]